VGRPGEASDQRRTKSTRLFQQGEDTVMRLTADRVQAIRQTTQRALAAGVRVSVFGANGAKALDEREGGDIELFFETDAQLENRAKVLWRLYGAPTLVPGDRKIDVLLENANTPAAPVFEIAKRTGILP